MSWRLRVAISIALFSLAAGLQADVTDLVVTESGTDAVLSWSTGTPPFRVVRSENPFFYYGNQRLAQGIRW